MARDQNAAGEVGALAVHVRGVDRRRHRDAADDRCSRDLDRHRERDGYAALDIAVAAADDDSPSASLVTEASSALLWA